MSWDAVIFDCDGVLVDSEGISNRVLAEMLTGIGLPHTVEQTVERFVGRSMASCLKLIEEQLGTAPPADFAAEVHRRTVAEFERELRSVSGVEAVLDELAWPFCVASSGDHEKIRATLTRTGLYPRFAGRIFSATEVPRGKPNPDLFFHAARRMGARPARCAVVEDSLPGVQAAVAAGMTVFGYTGTLASERLSTAGAIVFDQMRELPALLERFAPAASPPPRTGNGTS